MNQKEWKLCSESCKYEWYNKARKIQKSLQYNQNADAVVIHHLRDTEEQRKYNDEHYELWGFEIDEYGNEHFEYGKYIIFVTKKEHSEIHSQSEETRRKISENNASVWKGKHLSDEAKHHLSVINTGKRHSKETIEKIRVGNTGKSQTEETKRKISAANKGKKRTAESRKKMSESQKRKYELGCVSPNKGRKHTEEAVQHMREAAANREPMSKDTKDKIKLSILAISELYKTYKSNGGELNWNNFQKDYKAIMESDNGKEATKH